MKNVCLVLSLLLIFSTIFSCKAKVNNSVYEKEPVLASEKINEYLPLLKGRKVGLVINHTSLIGKTHLLDTLVSLGINVTKIFTPEHGFRGLADAGELVKDDIDLKSGAKIISLYGKNKKPTAEHFSNLDVIVYDIQDIGVRFYTYSSTLHYVIQRSIESNLELIVLDRPNPNGHYVAGPVLEKGFESFVGLNPLPIVYGLTSGELAQMIIGENWASEKRANIKVIKCDNYTHNTPYILPIKPSPNLPNNQAINLYPSICLFEPTKISVGRGTNKQFQVIGGPDINLGTYTFTPEDKPGAQNPVNEQILCYGLDLSKENAYDQKFSLQYLLDFYQRYSKKTEFFTDERFFNLLAGNNWLIADIKAGKTMKELEAKWNPALINYKKIRKKYLLYTDFEE